ncbi:MAG: hypothetical protein VB089_08715 [Anaerolineaceae bacterium]|nr:hypothetical protein [Anaerolineaceae bacterium]
MFHVLATVLQTPVPYTDYVTQSAGLVNDLGMMPVIAAGAVIGLGIWLFSRAKRGAR